MAAEGMEGTAVARDQLKSIVERIERLERAERLRIANAETPTDYIRG